jgi:hypothetical protein
LSAGTCSIRYPRCRSSQPRAVGLRVWDAAFETLAGLGLLPTRKHAVDTTIVRRTNNRRKRGIGE